MACHFENYPGKPSLHPLSVQRKGNKTSTGDVSVGSLSVVCMKKNGRMVVGMVEEVSVEENDVLMKFLDPNGSSVYFHWPAIEDKCWVPVEHMLQLLSIPSVKVSGCHYIFLERELKDTQDQLAENI